jgi:hypothetical protein
MSRGSELYLERKKKEELAFLVVRFLKTFTLFEGIYRDFHRILESGQGFGGCGLFARVRDLEEQLVFEIKEKAHFLFRSASAADSSKEQKPLSDRLEQILLHRRGPRRASESREILADLRRSLVDRAIDANIGTGFHLFMILRECIYQLEVYVPRYGQELEQAKRLQRLALRIGSTLDEEEAHELVHIRQIVKRGKSVAVSALELAQRALERCHELFQETAELLRHLIEEAGDNEVLLINLLAQRPLVETVYGLGASEQILAHMYRQVERPGASGLEKALEQARMRCGNIEALERELGR